MGLSYWAGYLFDRTINLRCGDTLRHSRLTTPIIKFRRCNQLPIRPETTSDIPLHLSHNAFILMKRAAQESPNLLLQVDHSDRPVGLVEKQDAHLKGILHRAFSIFIFREVESVPQLLLQQRAFHKYHSGGLWTNTCCGHAEPDVPTEITASNRLQTEMGFSCPISFLGSFYYKKDVGNGMTEHEIDHVFAGFHNPSDIHPNPEEANAFKWIDMQELEKALLTESHEFTAWFPEALAIALKFLSEQR